MDWISVEDELPEHNRKLYSVGVEVIVCRKGKVTTAFYGRRIILQPRFYIYGAVINDVTHWMPLPEAPDHNEDPQNG